MHSLFLSTLTLTPLFLAYFHLFFLLQNTHHPHIYSVEKSIYFFLPIFLAFKTFHNLIKEMFQMEEINTNIKNLLLPLNQRHNIRHSHDFAITNKPWNEGKFNRKNNIGGISTIWKNAHFHFLGKETSHVISFNQFETYYFESAELRENNNLTSHSHGRTLEELFELSKQFKNFLSLNYNIHIDEKTAFNFVYIRVIDEGYIGYMAEYKVMLNLNSHFKKIYKNISFEHTDEYTDVKYMVDIIVKYNDIPVAGLSVKSTIYRDSTRPYLKKVKIMNQKGQNAFTSKTNLDVKCVYYNKDKNIDNILEISQFIADSILKHTS